MARATVITRQFCKAILRQHKGQMFNLGIAMHLYIILENCLSVHTMVSVFP